MRSRQRAKLTAGAGLATMLIGALMVWAPGAGADEHEIVTVDKVTVCHRTNAVTNPYRIIEVAVDGSDGSLGNGHNDHTLHTGPPFDFANPDKYEPPFSGDEWGDIIPPYQWGPNPEDHFDGYNWDESQTFEEQCQGAQSDPTTLTIIKGVAGNNAPVTWSYDFTGLVDTVTLTHTASSSAALEIDPDVTYAITESGTDGVVTASCTGEASESLSGRTLSVSVAEGGDAVCTFTNTFNTQEIIPIPPSFTYTLDVDKLNDADGDGEFSDGELAVAEGDDVTFWVTIRNTGTGAVTLTSLTDSFDGEVVDLLSDDVDLECNDGDVTLTVGSVLAAGSTTECTFVLEDYAPAGGEDRVNTVSVDTDQTTPSTDDSTVSTPEVEPSVVTAPPTTQPEETTTTTTEPEEVLGVQVVRELPRTGSGTRDLAGLGAALIGLGAALVVASRRREDFAS